MSIIYEAHRDQMALPLSWYSNTNICPAHFHAGVELVYMYEGELEATISGKTIILRKNQLLVVNCYSVHRFVSENSKSVTSVIPLNAVPSMQKLLTSNRFSENIVQDDSEGTLGRLMKLLSDHAKNEFIQKGLCYTILGYLTEHVPFDPIASSDRSDLICGILNYLNENYSSQLTVDHVAAKFGYSRSRFSHMFKTTVGYSLPQYLNMLRCRSIADALVSTDTPVSELALNAGFNNPHSFYTSFKSCYNMTPREYMLSHKKSPNSK